MPLPELNEIQKIRNGLKLTQKQLAKISGVSQSLIARIEAGNIDPGYSKVLKILRALDRIRFQEVTATEIMTKKVVGIQINNTMEQAAKKMNEYGVSQMPVYDGKKIVGSISERVILNQIAKGIDVKDISSKKVKEYMEESFPSVGSNTPLSTLSTLLEHNTAVIVIEKGQIIGIITKADLLKVVHR